MNAHLLRWLQIQWALCAIACLALVVISFRYSRSLDLMARSDSDRKSALAIAMKIGDLRKVIPVGRSQESTVESVHSRIQSGLRDIGISEEKVTSITPIGTTPILKTTFARTDTRVNLKGVELSELFAFIQSQESQLGVMCSAVEITTVSIANDATTRDTWDANVTLTQVIEQPKSR